MHLVPYLIAVQCRCQHRFVSIGIGIGIGIKPGTYFLFLNSVYSFIFLQSGNDADSDYFYMGYDTVVMPPDPVHTVCAILEYVQLIFPGYD